MVRSSLTVRSLKIGESVNSQGQPNQIANAIEEFILKLQSLNLPIHKEKEFFTSVEARKLGSQNGQVDDKAAALILQRYLDRINLLYY